MNTLNITASKNFVPADSRPTGVEFLDDDPASDYRMFYGRGENKYAVHPIGWSTALYGRPPVLGIVFADNEFLAARRACDLGFVPDISCLPEVSLLRAANKN